jgi:hypothetical protein
MLCSAILTVIAILWEKNYIAIYKGEINREAIFPPLEENEGIEEWSKAIKGIKIESELERYGTDFTVNFTFQTADGQWHSDAETQTICKWFSSDGEFHEELFQSWGKSVLKKCHKKVMAKTKTK